MRGEILGLERRRRWSDDEKLAIVLSVGVNGATVSQVAQRHEIRRQQIYAWRYELRRKGLLTPDDATLFLPVDITSPPEPPEACAPEASLALIEVVLRNGRSLRVDAHVDAAVLTRLIQAVEAA
ncbi:IS66-like element accessory protein TnpA [Leisingera sp. JC1]|uniref:IS66-like element accessory protein TnpA n=1 Tax=Leisingera sp. JC1 TaxID=1855282 RepID=UPI000803AA0F|nr:transposase [Leisingera sp. JC1]OBY24577.1 transposase [Leisingera sp. JC1]